MIVLFDISPAMRSAFSRNLAHINSELLRRNKLPIDCVVRSGTLSDVLRTAEWTQTNAHECAVLTPGNSWGFMNGGFDQAIIDAINIPSSTLQQHILKANHGYVPVGTSTAISLAALDEDYASTCACTHAKLTTLVHCPTMVVPEPIADNAQTVIFDVVWNFLQAVSPHDYNLLIPGIGTGYGQVPTETASQHILAAILIHSLDISPLTRALLVSDYLNKDYRAFGHARDLKLIALIRKNLDSDADNLWGKLLNGV